MLGSSTGAAAALGSLQLVTDELIAARGGSDHTQVTGDTLTPSQSLTGVVTFSGSAELTSTVSGPTGSTPAHDVVDGPVRVVEQGGAWRVSTFDFDSHPLVYYPQGGEAAADGVHLRVGFLLDNAGSTVALVGLSADAPNATVDVQQVVLTLSDATTEQGVANFGRGVPAGEVAFKRASAVPTHLDMTIRAANGSTADLSVTLNSTPA